ncbi:hypothetical protein Slin15195_G030870 [Septoria linicola]|uniref:PH domain-containing protein n=1 Tax=Septoria linicola TaxID=215465 RepID=A0A9Q9APD6_9PEZI|nr:hypothetical protein Slin14017_G029890 [Septoria linicola]USW49768.1 hypothetical protein Slin15195_G030870 [Septoria linicola]
MDRPAGYCEPITPTQDVEYKLPELSRSQTTLDVAEDSSPLGPPVPSPVIPVPVSSAISPAVDKRKSLRLRPVEMLDRQHAVPLPLMSDTSDPMASTTSLPAPQLRPKTSKMSLFNLFSKPKVEKLRGYAEPGLNGPSRGFSNSDASTTSTTRQMHPHTNSAKLRPSTSKSYSSKAAKLVVKEPAPPVPNVQANRMRSFDAPPLFQVWPQATKHADLEVSTLTSDVVSQKSRNRMIGTTLFVPGNDTQSLQSTRHRESIDSRMTSRTNVRPVGSNSTLSTKLIILVTSGYLLQYAASGPSDRYPEKVLQLQQESAAYASDLIPGKHHVLQVVQSVNDNGELVAAPPSFLSKLGLRSQMARRSTSNLLLVMPGAADLEEWMTAIRQEIERQGGKSARPDSSTSRLDQSGQSQLDLKKTPSLSHRYQVRRNAPVAKVSPTQQQTEMAASPRITTQEIGELQSVAKSIEQEKAVVTNEASSPRSRAGSDTPSTSSVAPSEHQRQLDKLRDSTRSSHASTMATTVASMTSRTNSMTSTTPVEMSKDGHEDHQDYVTAKGPYRNLASYSIPKRRSNVPLPLAGEPLSPRAQALHAVTERTLDSPLLPDSQRQKKPLSLAQSAPDLKQAAKFAPDARPESFLGELPDPSTWANMTMPSHKSSLQHSQSSPEVPQLRTLHSGHGRPLRNGSLSFSLPLRVNTSHGISQRVLSKRASQSVEGDAGLRSPIPAATTLIAKVDASATESEQSGSFPKRMSFAEHAAAVATNTSQPRRGSSSRLTLFSQAAPLAAGPPNALRRSPSMAVNATQCSQAQQVGSLRRPASLQVRTDHAPFLSSLRVSPISPSTHPRSATTVPIRSLKPSRSATAMPSSVGRPFNSLDTFNFSTQRMPEEETDQAMPLPARCDSPFKLAKPRKVRASASLPELDFGIPVVGLGPPAPPPKAPLPELPPANRPSSRAASRSGSRQEMRSCTPIGVAFGGSPTDPHASPVAPSPSFGLGIQVGGR